jgi:hypothetical protein
MKFGIGGFNKKNINSKFDCAYRLSDNSDSRDIIFSAILRTSKIQCVYNSYIL